MAKLRSLGKVETLIGAAGIAAIALGLYSASLIFTTFQQHRPLIEISANIKLKVALARIWLEEALGGDKSISFERDIYANVDEALSLGQAMLNGGKTVFGEIKAVAETGARASITAILADLRSFRRLTTERLKMLPVDKPGGEIDQAYDILFDRILRLLRDNEKTLETIIARDRAFLSRINTGVIFLICMALVGMVILVRRHRLRMEAQNAELEVRVRERTAELAKANELRADLTAMIAHDLRSPLTSVVSTAAMVEDGLFGPVNEEQRQWLRKIGASCRSLVDLVSDFLDLSKIEAGHIQLSKEEVRLDQLIRESADNYLALAKEKKISLRTRVDPALPRINGDPRRLDQVLSNLLSNAIKFTPGGGEIEVGAIQERAEEIKLWVRDTGMGIPPQEREQIFQKYRQASNAKEAKQKGTGLGLVICKMIVEAHAGRIWVESKEGKGTSFAFTIPLR